MGPACHHAESVVPFIMKGFWYCYGEKRVPGYDEDVPCGNIFCQLLPDLVYRCTKCTDATVLSFEHHTGCGFGLACPTCRRFYPFGSSRVVYKPKMQSVAKSPYDASDRAARKKTKK
jgi:DNA-directed RNA polymerase subunit RPC12/RpoP